MDTEIKNKTKKEVITVATNKRFEVGKTYGAWDSAVPHIQVLRRTEKTIWVRNDCSEWSMRIKIDDSDNEYVTDSSVPYNWQMCYTYDTAFEDEVNYYSE